ncbi:cyclodeaminase [Roseospira goensis]|uniref:Ornithine cyclodeaminase n=1 Tax=Roseospira goensis TaxID=391922 RepID=A0A7W6WJ41_9PROT|nr:cyclodeaminase [Roseospira goensis]MBB4284625.1 ornithine cyclodeaminase [Roseospira goensis]
MPTVRIVTEAELRAVVPLDGEAVACVEQAFVALAGGGVVMPPILRLDIVEAHGEVDVKTAYVPGLDSFAIKISPGFFDNPKLGLPSVNGLMTLFSARTGLLEAVLLDNGFLTDVRTAAAGAVAAKHLARTDARRVAVIGAGVQARLQLDALTLVRPIESATVWARDADKAAAYAAEMTARRGLPVTAAASVAEAVADADIVVLTTPATAPLLMADHLTAGQHVTAMGSDAEHKNELDPAAIRRADLYVADSLSQTRRLGELHHAIAAGLVGADEAFPELGAVVTGAATGRTDPAQITIADLTGTGVQDTAIATLALARADRSGAGSAFES